MKILPPSQELLEIADEWKMWPVACLRGTGFPAGEMLALGISRSIVAEVDLRRIEKQFNLALANGIRALEPAIEKRNGKDRRPFSKAILKLRRGTLPRSTERLAEAAPEIEEALAIQQCCELARTVFNKEFDLDLIELKERLMVVAKSPLFREALAWQNLNALRTGVDKIETSSSLKYQRLIVNYLQRYVTKNDTIGFFGPVGWASISIDVHKPTLTAGNSLLSKRTVYFEHWAIHEVAKAFAEDQNLWSSFIPRRSPTIYLDGSICHIPGSEQIEIPIEFVRLMEVCDGMRTAKVIAEMCQKEGIVEDIDEAYELLADAANEGLITWLPEIPTAGFFPEQYLEELLRRTPGTATELALESLRELTTARDRVAAAQGNDVKLCEAQDELNSKFIEITGQKASRSGGQTYAGRTLVYEDCLRNVDLQLSADFVEKISHPMSLILKSARWYTWEIAQRYMDKLETLFDTMSSVDRKKELSFVHFQTNFRNLFPGPDTGGGIVEEVTTILQNRWADILNVDCTQKVIQISSGLIEEKVAGTFQAPGPGWPSARHQSPDVLISARNFESIQSGEYDVILGEIHVGLATPSIPLFAKEYPDELYLAYLRENDLPTPGIAPTWNNALRANLFSLSRHDFDLETGAARSHRPREQVISIGACVVYRERGELFVRSRETNRVFHLLEFIEQHLIAESYSEFSIFGKMPHSPRVMIDNLTIKREQWWLSSASFPRLTEGSRAETFLAVRAWSESLGIPRFCFVKTKSEPKPFFLDLENPVSIENFVRSARQTTEMMVSEMLPDFDNLWLPDLQDRRYCSELRLCFKDPVAWSTYPCAADS